MGIFFILVFSALAIGQYVAALARYSKLKKTNATWIVFMIALIGGVFLGRKIGLALPPGGSDEALGMQLLFPILANILAGMMYLSLPFLILDHDEREKYRKLPGMRPELVSGICLGLSLIALAVLFNIGNA
jgi:hypothetical protein